MSNAAALFTDTVLSLNSTYSTPPNVFDTRASARGVYALGEGPPALTFTGVRKNIYTLINSKYEWPIFVQSIIAMQDANANAPDGSLSHFAMAAIHGEPYMSWNGSWSNARTGNTGYCTHGSVLFPTWHRPYTAMYEQIMHQHAVSIAQNYQSDESQFMSAASGLRFPYWDWGVDATPPDIFLSGNSISIRGPSGSNITVRNPFVSYAFNGAQSRFDSRWSGYPQTVRYPNSANPVGDLKSNLRSLQQQNIQHLQQMFQFVNDWQAFSNHNSDPQNQDKSNSLEAMHDAIHVTVGGFGHFSDPSAAAFDPLFFLHHSQVDRLLALWQVFHPNSWVVSSTIGRGSQTRWLRSGDSVSSSTGLAPFWENGQNYWTSDESRSISAMQYTYPEFQGASNSQVKQRVAQLYGFSSGKRFQKRGKHHGHKHKATHVKLGSGNHHPNLTTIDVPLRDGQYYDWTARIRFHAMDIGRSFAVHVFLGKPASNVTSYTQAPEYVGSAYAFTRAKMGDQVTQHFVQLSRSLSERGMGGDLDPNIVTPYLTKNLCWLVTEADSFTPIDVSKLPSLEVLVMNGIVTPAQTPDSFSTMRLVSTLRAITSGKLGGAVTVVARIG